MIPPQLGKLPKLSRDVYRGYQLIHWTLTFEERAAARHPLMCPIYVIMPDHLHLLWSGLSPATDQRSAMMLLRRRLKMAVRPFRLQRQAHDPILRSPKDDDRAFEEALQYIWENPVRAGLVENAERWPYAGSIVPGYPLLHPRQENWRRDVDKIYTRLRSKLDSLERSGPPSV